MLGILSQRQLSKGIFSSGNRGASGGAMGAKPPVKGISTYHFAVLMKISRSFTFPTTFTFIKTTFDKVA